MLLRYSREGAVVAREMGVPAIDSNDVLRDYKGNRADLSDRRLKAMVKPN
ncbi:hypothetical protein [Reyranella sp.]|nr:hypothetical protein [Reyranella sp.]